MRTSFRFWVLGFGCWVDTSNPSPCAPPAPFLFFVICVSISRTQHLAPDTLLRYFLRLGALDRDDVIDGLLEGVVVRDDEELVEVADLADLLGEPLAPLGVHVDGRLVEEGDADVRELLQEGETDRERRDHLLAAREVDEGTLVPALFEDDVVVLRPA